MVEVHRRTSAGVAAVWEVLADGWKYPVWVVGASRMRAVSSDWPAVGATLHHSLGSWPLLIKRHDTCTRQPARTELKVRGRGWPTGEVEVEVLLEPTADGGSEVTMRDVAAGPARLLPEPLRHLMMGPRNNESLHRLAYLTERRSR
jgi:hypothetical protein